MELGGEACALEADDARVVIILKNIVITLILTLYEKLNDGMIILYIY